MTTRMTSLQRILTALSHQEPDRVPLLLLTNLHGAKEIGLPIRAYYSRPENVVEGQLRLRAKYRSDCLYNFFYAAREMEAWGCETIFTEDGPPNAGMPILKQPEEILRLEPPKVAESPGLLDVLEVTRKLKAHIGEEALILGVVMAPTSLPVMQMGFDNYIELIYNRPDLLQRLLSINEEFCVEWANAQLAAGATAICYFDPVSSPTIVPSDLSHAFLSQTARQTIARFHGPTAVHLASGRCLPILEDVAQTGTLAVGVSASEDLAEVKAACHGRLALVGNLNAVEMRRWKPEQAEAIVKHAIAKAGRGGGFLLADNHGEIPWQVPDEVLLAIGDAVERWGHYPLDWISTENENAYR
jgi:uroporphyrinogen decarboxylase